MFLYEQYTTCEGKSQQQQQESEGDYMCNKEVREYAQKNNVKLWQVAKEIGVSDGNFSRKLRIELPEGKKAEIYSIIDKLAAEQKAVR